MLINTVEDLAGIIDHTLLRPDITYAEIHRHCDEAKQYRFKTVAINNANIEYCLTLLENSPVLIDAAVGFPLGQSTIETKLFETQDALSKGAREIDYVINIGAVKSKDFPCIEREMKSIVRVCEQAQAVSKVIFEICYLNESEITELCKIAGNIGPDFIKTSTGFGTGGATIEAVELMRKKTDKNIKIKAAGGIRNLGAVYAFVAAGAERIGTSSGIQIITQYLSGT